MKKYLLFALAVGTLVSCDPLKEDGTFVVDSVSAEQLLQGATFSQYNDAACTQAASDGNYIKYNIPSVSSVYIYYLKKDGTEFKLQHGQSAGVFCYVPLRGSDPNQTLYFRYINPDGVETVASHEFTLQVAAELSPETKLLTSNSGAKKWGWKPTSVNGGAVWGNAGYQNPQDGSDNINGAWWGCGPLDGECGDKFDGQLQHSAAGAITGEEYLTAYMEFNEDGSLTKYDKDGNKLNAGTFEITGYNGGAAIDDHGTVAYLNTSAGAILWPYQINNNGYQPERFEVGHLSVDRMVLIYAPEGTGGWSECTWWSFGAGVGADPEGYLTDNESAKWGWLPTSCNGGASWGNGGYQAGEQDGSGNINGAWWGCGPVDGEGCGNTFADQLSHSAAGDLTGEEYLGSYMEFNVDGSLTKYDKDGGKLGSGTFAWDMTPTGSWNIGTLSTSAGAILWPYMINSAEHYQPTTFEIGYLSGDKLVLIYAPEGQGGWGECTWWSFGKKK